MLVKYYLHNSIKCFIAIMIIVVTFFSCEKEALPTIENKNTNLETVSAVDALSVLNTNAMSRSNATSFITQSENMVKYDGLTNLDQQLATVRVQTIHPDAYSRALFLRVNDTLKTVVYSMYSNNNFETTTFNGQAFIMDLEGNVINGFRVEDGYYVAQYQIPDGLNITQAQTGYAQRNGSGNDGDVWGGELNEIVLTASTRPNISHFSMSWYWQDTANDSEEGGNNSGDTGDWEEDEGSGPDAPNNTCPDGYVFYLPLQGCVDVEEIKICPSSFDFKDLNTTANWQTAGIKNVSILFLTIGSTSKLVNIYFHELYIGFPKNSDLVGGYLTNHNANNLAEQLFTQAEALTDVFQSINPNSDEFDLRDYFYSKLEELIQANGGGLSTSPPLGWTGTLKTHKTYLVSQSLECD